MGGNWLKMRTLSGTWSDQGFHYYKGLAWYRTEFNLPASAQKRKLYLWFGGVDEEAKVWVNGKYVGSSTDPGGGLPGVPQPFKPVDFDITEVVRFDKANTIAVRIKNVLQNEVGTGGIVAPVMIWSPKDINDDPARPDGRNSNE